MQPSEIAQTISILPRSNDLSNPIDVRIRRDGDGTEETLLNVTAVVNVNHLDLTFTPTILTEGYGYFLEVTTNGNLIYRDKIYATTQTNFKVKHNISSGEYQEYNSIDDNTYIV